MQAATAIEPAPAGTPDLTDKYPTAKGTVCRLVFGGKWFWDLDYIGTVLAAGPDVGPRWNGFRTRVPGTIKAGDEIHFVAHGCALTLNDRPTSVHHYNGRNVPVDDVYGIACGSRKWSDAPVAVLSTPKPLDREAMLEMAARECRAGLVVVVIDPSRKRGMPVSVNIGGGDTYYHIAPDSDHAALLLRNADLVLRIKPAA